MDNILKRLLRLIPDGVFAIDLYGRVIFWNKALEEMTGILEEEIVGKGDFEYAIAFYGYRRPMPVDYILNPEIASLEPLTKRGDIYELETFLPKLYNGKGSWVILSASAIVDESCDLIGAVQIVKDINERKIAEIELSKLNKIVEHSPLGIALLEFSGTIIYCNASFLRYTGFSNLIGRNIFDIFPQISLYEIHNGYLKEIKHNGKIFRLRGIKLNDVDIQGYVIFLSDITEIRKYEEQRIISYKMESVSKLTSTYAHEMKNILTGVKGLANLALQANNKKLTEQYINKMISMIDALLKNLREILGVGREIGKNPEVLDLRSVIENITSFLKLSLRDNIELKLIIHDDPIRVFADKTDIEKIITNLVLNAQDALPEGGQIVIEVSVKELPEKFKTLITNEDITKDYVCINVSDNGIGMNEEVKKKIFEPFFTTKGERGTGLGLSTVYHIVQLLKGFIFVDSEIGKGTKFEIFIPIKHL
ncbi:MAG: PAS domain S-box protein [Thermodesulfovibrio sp.]|nr:PAS domain S-box protein [Thermodesulfovibrio sp.]MDW7999201.1 PAS domain S-box protein [Thermodesulfovibrio sp.]